MLSAGSDNVSKPLHRAVIRVRVGTQDHLRGAEVKTGLRHATLPLEARRWIVP